MNTISIYILRYFSEPTTLDDNGGSAVERRKGKLHPLPKDPGKILRRFLARFTLRTYTLDDYPNVIRMTSTACNIALVGVLQGDGVQLSRHQRL
jgi:hypothetical protein